MIKLLVWQDCAPGISRGLCVAFKRHAGADGCTELYSSRRYFFFVALRPNAGHGLLILDHTQRRTTVGRTPLDKWSARRRDLYQTTHNTHNRQISMPPVGFEPTISAGERPQTYALQDIGWYDRQNCCRWLILNNVLEPICKTPNLN